jgi:D-serine deaminase-like pyridoxal phosphate-dependent protein
MGSGHQATTGATGTLDALDTPSLLLDAARMERNIARMRARAEALGVALRPHLKTVKSVDVARRIVAPHEGITVSTLREAEYFADAGYTDIFYAVAVPPQKLARAAALQRRGVRLRLAVDDPAAAGDLLADAARLGMTLEALVEVDSGDGRSGVDPGSGALLEIAGRLGDAGALAGVFTHGGHAYAGCDAAQHARTAEQERQAVVLAAGRVRDAGHRCDIVSLGSTPSVTHARALDGVTEVRAGVYVLGDVFQAAIGSCTLDDVAASVLATVVGNHPGRGQLVIDAGALALSKDVSTRALGDRGDCGYGLVADAATGRPIDGLYVHGVSQEHGIVRSRGTLDHARFPVGRRLRILPVHACLTAAAHDRYHVLGEGGAIAAVWPRINGW